MQTVRIRSIEDFSKIEKELSSKSTECVVALGFFDGMHLAHKALIDLAREEAKKTALPLVIFAFSADDTNIKNSSPKLFTDEERLSIFEECSASYTLLVNFGCIYKLSGEEFVNKILIEKLNTRTAVCGFNFRFGYRASHNADDLKSLMQKAKRSALILNEYTYNGIVLSSSYIRELLGKKKLFEAAKRLGKPYFISGEVSHGLGLGKKLGIPTVNIALGKAGTALPNGVYFTVLLAGGKLYPALTNVGSCPTFDERETHMETFILNFDGDLYNEKIRVYFIKFLREEKRFDDANELIMQIKVDKKRALKLVRETKWQEIGLNLQ